MRNNDLGGLIACAALAMVTLTFATHASAQPLPPTSPPQIAPALVPAHVVDLMTADGIGTFGAQWKTTEAKIVEGPALPNAMPGYKTSYDISPVLARQGSMIHPGRPSTPRGWPTGAAAARCRSCGSAPT